MTRKIYVMEGKRLIGIFQSLAALGVAELPKRNL
jgi:hypothetical protein